MWMPRVKIFASYSIVFSLLASKSAEQMAHSNSTWLEFQSPRNCDRNAFSHWKLSMSLWNWIICRHGCTRFTPSMSLTSISQVNANGLYCICQVRTQYRPYHVYYDGTFEATSRCHITLIMRTWNSRALLILEVSKGFVQWMHEWLYVSGRWYLPSRQCTVYTHWTHRMPLHVPSFNW